LLALAGSGYSQVVINEFNYEDSSTDNLEFVELYNKGVAPVDISGYSVVAGNSATVVTLAIPGASGSNTTVLAAQGYYTIGHRAIRRSHSFLPLAASLMTMKALSD